MGKNTQADVVNTEKTESKGTYVHKFSTPFEYEGKKYESLNFYFDKLTGDDMIRIEDEMTASNQYSLTPEISTAFLSKMAARAAGIGSDVLGGMPLKEFKKIRDVARDYLLEMGL